MTNQPYPLMSQLFQLGPDNGRKLAEEALEDARSSRDALKYYELCIFLGICSGDCDLAELWNQGLLEAQGKAAAEELQEERICTNELDPPDQRVYLNYLTWERGIRTAFNEELPEGIDSKIKDLESALTSQTSLFSSKPLRRDSEITLNTLKAYQEQDEAAMQRVYYALCELPVHGVFPWLNLSELLLFLDGSQKLRASADQGFRYTARTLSLFDFFSSAIGRASIDWRNFDLGREIDEKANPYDSQTLDLRLTRVSPYGRGLLRRGLISDPHEYVYRMIFNQIRDRVTDKDTPWELRVLPQSGFIWFKTPEPEKYVAEVAKAIASLPQRLVPEFLR